MGRVIHDPAVGDQLVGGRTAVVQVDACTSHGCIARDRAVVHGGTALLAVDSAALGGIDVAGVFGIGQVVSRDRTVGDRDTAVLPAGDAAPFGAWRGAGVAHDAAVEDAHVAGRSHMDGAGIGGDDRETIVVFDGATDEGGVAVVASEAGTTSFRGRVLRNDTVDQSWIA